MQQPTINNDLEALQTINSLIRYFDNAIKPSQPLATELASRILYALHSLVYDATANQYLSAVCDQVGNDTKVKPVSVLSE